MSGESLKVLERVAAKLGGVSDYRAAHELRVSRKAVSNWRNGNHFMADDAAIRAAEILGERPEAMLAYLSAERTKSAKARALWSALARRLQRSAATVAGLTVGATALLANAAGHSLQCILC
jgi:plasmid maintenance system antidote protein VapI